MTSLITVEHSRTLYKVQTFYNSTLKNNVFAVNFARNDKNDGSVTFLKEEFFKDYSEEEIGDMPLYFFFDVLSNIENRILYYSNHNLMGDYIYEKEENNISSIEIFTVMSWDVSEGEDNSVIAVLESQGVLNILGNGNTKDYYDFAIIPWYSLRDCINEINVDSGVTSIGKYLFRRMY